jgi:hypothetical protein
VSRSGFSVPLVAIFFARREDSFHRDVGPSGPISCGPRRQPWGEYIRRHFWSPGRGDIGTQQALGANLRRFYVAPCGAWPNALGLAPTAHAVG